jgi:hypothetical protein
MKIEYAIAKLEKMTNKTISDIQSVEIQKILDDGAINWKLVSEQISLGLENLNERRELLKSYKKDSTSLAVNILRYGDIEGQKRFNIKIESCAITLDKYIKKYGEVEGTIEYKKYCISKGMSLEGFIHRDGDIEGPIKWRQYWDTTGFGTNERAFKKRYGDDYKVEFDKYKEDVGYRNTLDYHIETYGKIEGTAKYTDSNKRKSISQSKETYVKNMLEDNIPFNEILINIDKRWNTVSKIAFIRNHGEIDGTLRYEDYVKKCKLNSVLSIEYYLSMGYSKEDAFAMVTEIQVERNSLISKYSKESLRYLDVLSKYFTSLDKQTLYKNEGHLI